MSDLDPSAPDISIPDPAARSAADLRAVLDRLDAVVAEVRRQGRAGVAAQAAAEACLREVNALKSTTSSPASPDAPSGEAPSALGARALAVLIPLFDAIDGAVFQLRATRPPEPRSSSRGLRHALRSRLERLRRGSADAASEGSVRRGLELIQAEARSALDRMHVELDERAGVPVDPERHRVVEVRAAAGGHGGLVLEVLRPAYLVGGVCVREADVVASRSR